MASSEEKEVSSAPRSTTAILAHYIINWHQKGANYLQVPLASGPGTLVGCTHLFACIPTLIHLSHIIPQYCHWWKRFIKVHMKSRLITCALQYLAQQQQKVISELFLGIFHDILVSSIKKSLMTHPTNITFSLLKPPEWSASSLIQSMSDSESCYIHLWPGFTDYRTKARNPTANVTSLSLSACFCRKHVNRWKQTTSLFLLHGDFLFTAPVELQSWRMLSHLTRLFWNFQAQSSFKCEQKLRGPTWATETLPHYKLMFVRARNIHLHSCSDFRIICSLW